MPVCQSCFCHQDDCACYRFNRDYLSPVVPVTTLVITGNHPATLVAHIEYHRAFQDVSGIWYCTPVVQFGTIFDHPAGNAHIKCCVSGEGFFDCDESPTVWQDSFCCQLTITGSIEFEQYVCCDRPGTSNDEWILAQSGSLSGIFAIASTLTHAVWYRKMAVRMYAGELDGCCGVYVEVCLTFNRLTPSVYDSETQLNGSVTDYEGDCFGVNFEEPVVSSTCTADCGSASGPVDCPEPFDAEELIDCNPLANALGLQYSILRRKFIPGNPACTARSLPQLSVTLTSADNVTTQIVGCGGCVGDQVFGGVIGDLCVPDRVYYDRGTYADATPECCDDPLTVECGSAGSRTSGFAAFLGTCHTQCDNQTEFDSYSVWNNCWDNVTENCPSSGFGGSQVVQDFANALGACYPFSPSSVIEITSRTNTVEDECSVDPCDYLLFGELDDEWNLTITLPS